MSTWRHWALALALTLAAGGPLAAAPREITIVANGKMPAADAFRTEFMRRTQDRIVVDIRAGQTLGSEGEILKSVQSGAADMSLVTGAVISAAVPRYAVFDIPFLLRDAEHARKVTEGPVEQRIAAAFPDAGLVLLGIGEQGFREITNSKHPITTPADLRGLTIRVIPNDLYKMSFEAFGARVVPMDFTLLHAALIDGRVDAQENPPSTILSSGFQDAQPYLSLTHHVYSTVGIVMNKATYDSLDDADRAALAAGVTAAKASLRQDAEEDNAKSLAVLRQSGMQVTDQVDRAAFEAALKPLEPEFERRFGRDLLTEIRQTH